MVASFASSSWTNATAGAKTNAALKCTGIDAPQHSTYPNPPPAQQIEFSPPYAACQDADQDGILNAFDNCPLTPNGPRAHATDGSADQADGVGDGIGGVCDPLATGPGLASNQGYGRAGFIQAADLSGNPDAAAGSQDVCDQTFTTSSTGTGSGVGASAPVCTLVDADASGAPDFAWGTAPNASGTPVAVCVQDHAGDANGDGYSDAAEGTTAGWSSFGVFPPCVTSGLPAGYFAPYPASGGLGTGAAGVGVGCYGEPTLAKADINLDGQVNGLDLNQLASHWTAMVTNPTDPAAESDLNHDHFVNGIDLNQLAGRYTSSVAGSCGASPPQGQTTVCPPRANPLANVYDQSLGGCVQVIRAAGGGTAYTYAVVWDRLPAGAHAITITCGTSVNLSMPISAVSGRAVFQSIQTAPCTVGIDGKGTTTFSS